MDKNNFKNQDILLNINYEVFKQNFLNKFNETFTTITLKSQNLNEHIFRYYGLYNFKPFLIFGIYQLNGEIPTYKTDKIFNSVKNSNYDFKRIFVFSNQQINLHHKLNVVQR